MVPPDPSPFYAVVFRGGDVTFLPATVALEVMSNKADGQSTVAIDAPSACVLDLAAVERIQPFGVWRRGHEIKLAASGRRVCAFGFVHDEDDECWCYRRGHLPMTLASATKLLTLAANFHALPDDSAARVDHKHADWLPDAIESGYIYRVAESHGLNITLLPQTPTHD